MARKKIIDVNEGKCHLVCIQDTSPLTTNPYQVYIVISPTGAPVRKRLLIKYADFISVLCFIRDFYVHGMDVLSFSDMKEWIKSRTI